MVVPRVSAKEQSGISLKPEANYIRVQSNGTCHWWPSSEMSASRCRMDVAFFPFDEQRCYLIYESWRYPDGEMNVTAMENVLMEHYQTSGEWHLNGTSLFDNV